MAVHILPVARAHVYLDVQVNTVKHVLTVSKDFFSLKYLFFFYTPFSCELSCVKQYESVVIQLGQQKPRS